MSIILITAAILPVIFFLIFIYRKDSSKEPFGILLKCLFGGLLSVLLSMVFSLPLYFLGDYVQGVMLKAMYEAFFVASIPEELGKFIILYWFVWKSKEFNQHFDGIVYAVFISLGFALIENVLYVFSGGMSVAVARALLAIPGHGFFGVLMGYFLSRAKFQNEDRKKNITRAIMYPIIFHGLYDFFLMWITNINGANLILSLILYVAFIVVVVLLWRAGLRAIRIHSFKDFVDGIKW